MQVLKSVCLITLLCVLAACDFFSPQPSPQGTNVPARPGDELRRFDECAVLDFLRMLGVRVKLQDSYVQVSSPVFRSLFKDRSPQSTPARRDVGDQPRLKPRRREGP